VPVTVEKVMGEVARFYNITVADIRSRKRTANISDARKTAMYCIREITGMSMEDIGKECGGRDHSTVVYSIKAVEEQIDTNSSFKDMVEDILKNTRAN
jgi:chromosomal replication initiator protein